MRRLREIRRSSVQPEAGGTFYEGVILEAVAMGEAGRARLEEMFEGDSAEAQSDD